MRLSKLFLAASAAVLLAACQPSAETKSETTSETKAAAATTTKSSIDNVPHAQLPNIATPQTYRVDMMIDPQEEGMSGTVAIDVKVNETSDHIWIHAKEMTVSAARIDYKDGTSETLTFTPIPLEEAPSGIAYLKADKDLPTGDAYVSVG